MGRLVIKGHGKCCQILTAVAAALAAVRGGVVQMLKKICIFSPTATTLGG